MPTLYASFSTLSNAEQAVGALLDRGLPGDHIHLISSRSQVLQADVDLEQQHAHSGVVTATPAEASHDAVGAGTAMLHGLEAVVSVIVRGFGLIVGENAAGSTVAAAIDEPHHPELPAAYFEGQGVPPAAALNYQQTVAAGGVVLAIELDPKGAFDQQAVSAVLNAYQGQSYVWDGAPPGTEPAPEETHSTLIGDPVASMLGQAPFNEP